MPVFIPPTGGGFDGKWRRGVVLVRVKYTAYVLKWLFTIGVCWDWTEACTVPQRELKAFGIVVRSDPEPALRVCLVSQTMLLSYSALFEVRACG